MKDKIFEMVGMVLSMGDDSAFNIQNHESIDIEQLTIDDNDPIFVNVEVIRNGQSGNNRIYDDNIVKTINSMIPGTMGYLGHPDPGKHGFEFREPHCVYVGSQLLDMGNGVLASIGKAYIFKSSPLREWIPKSMIAGNPMTVSINARGDVYNDMTTGLKYVKGIDDLESIDWANPGTEGMSSSTAISIVKEMKDEEDNNMENRESIVKGVSIAEMKAFNPNIVNTLLKSVTIEEFRSNNESLYNSIVESGKITEMTLSIGGKDEVVKIDSIQELFNTKQSEITNLENKIAEMELKETKDRLISEMVSPELVDKIVPRITGITEQEIKTSIQKELDYITELSGVRFDNMPRGNSAKITDGDVANSVKKLFGVAENK